MTAPPLRRPVLRYHGGKWRLAPWTVGFFPPHRTYVEPFGGGASVLMRKPRAYAEIYNDLDGEIVNVFRVLRNTESAATLERALRLTPFARTEFNDAHDRNTTDPIERARRTIVRSFMGFGSDALADVYPRGMRTRASTRRVLQATGFRANSNRSHTTPAHDWANYPDQLRAFCERLTGVVIENYPAARVIKTHDRAEALIYCDPPYVHSTRRPRKKGAGGGYTHEMTDDDHRGLSKQLHSVAGMVIVSGYPSVLYDVELYGDWERHERQHTADGARKRTEVIYLNAACSKARAALELGVA